MYLSQSVVLTAEFSLQIRLKQKLEAISVLVICQGGTLSMAETNQGKLL